MRQTRAVLKTLKVRLKHSGLKYAEVAEHLQLSEASVKRLFAEGSFSMERLESVCELIDLDLVELFDLHRRQESSLSSLTLQQEQEIAADIELLMVALSVMNGMNFEQLIAQYNISETQCIRKLALLDKLKFLELLPGNRVRLLISSDFRWQKDGPIQQFFFDQVAQEFFNSRFQKDNEKLLVLNGILSPTSNLQLQEKMDKFAREFAEMNEAEEAVPMEQRSGNTLVLAIRQWQFNQFTALSRNQVDHKC